MWHILKIIVMIIIAWYGIYFVYDCFCAYMKWKAFKLFLKNYKNSRI